MQWASAASNDPKLITALGDVTAELCARLHGRAPDLLVVFVSPHHAPAYDHVPDLLGTEFPEALVLGCSAGGVIGGARELEGQPGFSVTAGVLPGTRVEPLCLQADSLPGPAASAGEWEASCCVTAVSQPHFLLLPDPFSFPTEVLLQGLDRAYPTGCKIGGLASGARGPGGNALFLGDRALRSGAVGVALTGNIAVESVVAQGCRPIGDPMFVTGCQRNIAHHLDGRPALEVLRELIEELDQRDRELARHSLFLGIAMREDRHEHRQGDFLIRNLVGMDPDTGALAVGAFLEENAVVQFHLRDAKTSAEDLEEMLGRYVGTNAARSPSGALLFSCLGRGVHLYGQPNHDTEVFQRHFGDVPLGGFFCNGEVGPVQGTTFLHGYTSAFGLFRPRD